MKHLIRAALFDLDGVVVFTDRYHYLSWKRLCDEKGWDFNEEVNHRLRGIPRMASLLEILDHNRRVLPLDEREALCEKKNAYYLELLEGINEGDLYPGVVAFLQALKARGVLLGLCSSSKNAQRVLDLLNLSPLFDTVVTGHDFKHAKPDPEVFLTGAARLRVPPFHCVVFEDAYSGVQAARAAKMRCIGVGSPEVLTNAVETIQRYEEIDLDALLDTGRPQRVVPEPWGVSEIRVNPRRAQYWETLFALTNGFMGLRGTHEEDDDVLRPHAYPGFFLNGIYDYEPYQHIVSFPGYPQQRHVMLNLCDWRIIHLEVGGERFSLGSGRITDYRRTLDVQRGVVERRLTWESPGGRRVRIRTTRLVSMTRRHSAAIRYEVTLVAGSGPVVFESVIHARARKGQLAAEHVELVDMACRDNRRYLVCKPKTASFTVAGAFCHALTARSASAGSNHLCCRDESFVERFEVPARQGETLIFDKHACFHTSIETPEGDVLLQALEGVATDRTAGFDVLLAEQTSFWRTHWETADIEIRGNVVDQQAVRFALFHLRQSNPEDDHRSISACGMTGDHYWGHVFWDTEMYILPSFLYTRPETVRPLLMYRYHLLDRARERAKEMGGIGALYAWNSISGEECGIIYEASTAEYHLVSAIAYAIWRYTKATGDSEFLYAYGAEMLFETARFLADRGKFIPLRDGRFCLNVVCGPDEYGCGINNNCYTNLMAQWHFGFACRVYDRMAAECPQRLAALAERIGLSADERALWQRAADRMYVPYHEGLGIHMQDDSFLYLDPVDMQTIPRFTDIRELVHPLNLWRMQVAKQADVVLLMFVLGDRFSLDQKRRNYAYYEPRTNHGSSLSPSIHSIVAAEIGRTDEAYTFFRHSALMDLNDFKNNTAGGVHSACLGGTWMAVVNGFAGMRDYESGLQFRPVLPDAWDGYRFRLRYEGRLLEVDVRREKVTYQLLDGPSVEFVANDRMVRLAPDAAVVECPTLCAPQE